MRFLISLLISSAIAEIFWIPPIILQKWWPKRIRTVDDLLDYLESNTTFLFEIPDQNGLINGHPDLNAGTVLITYNQSSFRNFANKKLYLHYEIFRHYKMAIKNVHTNFVFFFLFSAFIRGPYGLEPLLDLATFNKDFAVHVQSRTIVVGWTSMYPDDERAPFGYTAEMVREMEAVLKNGTINFPVIEFDAVHASWSKNLLVSLFHVTPWVMFTTAEESQYLAKRINLTELNRMVQQCGLNRTYLRVHETVRQFIVPPPPIKTKKPMRFRSRFGRNGGNSNEISSFAIFLLLGLI